MEKLDRCFIALHPELNSAQVSPEEKARVVVDHVGTLIGSVGMADVRWALCEMAVSHGVPPEISAKAARLLPELVGGNVDRDTSEDEMF